MSATEIILPRKITVENIKRYYSRVAWIYEVWSCLTESKAAAMVLDLAEIRNGEQILEVAIGTGIMFEEIIKQNNSGRNYGLDLSPNMMARARKRLRKLKENSFHLQLSSAYQLPFKNQQFDLIVNNFMFDLLPEDDFVTILVEFKRVLKPSGRVVISVMTFGHKWYNKFWTWVAKQFPDLLTGCRPISMLEYLYKAGFSVSEVKTVSQNTFLSEVIRARNENHIENCLA